MKFAMEAQYLVPIYKRFAVEAENEMEAMVKSAKIADEVDGFWENSKTDYDSSRPITVANVSETESPDYLDEYDIDSICNCFQIPSAIECGIVGKDSVSGHNTETLLRWIADEIGSFSQDCWEQGYTDTDHAWQLLNGIQKLVLEQMESKE